MNFPSPIIIIITIIIVCTCTLRGVYLGRVAHPFRKRIRARGNCKITVEGRGRGMQRRARSVGVVHHVRTRGVSGRSPRRAADTPGYHQTFPTPPDNTIPDNFLDNYGRGEAGRRGTWLFKRGWGEKRKRHGSRSAALIAAGNRATMKLISNTEISGKVSRGGKKWLPENGDGKSVRVYRSIVETDCELLQCKSYELCSHWFCDYAIRSMRRIDSFFIDLKETRVS